MSSQWNISFLLQKYRGSKSPTYWQMFRETLGQALRETGQHLDQYGLKLASLTWLPDKYIGKDPPVLYRETLSRHRGQMPLLHCGKPVVSKDAAFVAPCATLIGNVRVQPGASIWYGAILRADTCLNAKSFYLTDEQSLRLAQKRNPMLQQHHQQPPRLDNPQPKLIQDDDNSLSSASSSSSLQQEKETETTETKAIQEHDDEDKYDFLLNETEEERKQRLVVEERTDGYEKGGGIYIGPDTNIQDGVVVTAHNGNTILGQGVTVGHLAQIHSSTIQDFCLIGMGSYLGEGVFVETESFIAAGAVVPPGTRVGQGELWVGNPARKLRDLTPEQRKKLHYQSDEYVKVALTQQQVQELGGNLPASSGWTLLKAMQYNMEQEALFGESMEEYVARNNLWRNTVYRQYVTPYPLPQNDTKDDNVVASMESGQQHEQQQQQLDAGQQQQPLSLESATTQPKEQEQTATAAEPAADEEQKRQQPSIETASVERQTQQQSSSSR